MKLWVDDVRPAPDGYKWCKSVNEAKEVIEVFEAFSKLSPIELIDLGYEWKEIK